MALISFPTLVAGGVFTCRRRYGTYVTYLIYGKGAQIVND